MSEQLLRWLEDGQRALEAGRFTDAIDPFTRVRDLLPTDTSIAIALANVFRLSGNVAMARRTLLMAWVNSAWTDATVAHSLGAALLDAGAPREAASCFGHVVSLLPNSAAALGALAGAHRTLGDPAAAWPLIQRALAKAPADPALLLTAAQIRHDFGDLTGTLQFLDRSEHVRPNHAATQLQRAYSMLLHGAFGVGWTAFEGRALPVPATAARAWHGEPLNGASVLVTAEQGVGDQFQFVRFVAHLIGRGAGRVVVECHADAVSLFAANGLEAVARGAPPETDWHVPMLSLPHRLGLDANVAGDLVPYLRAPNAPSVRPAGRTDERRIGLVWAGNPSFSGRVTRDFDPALLPDIVAIPGIEWISLQHGDAGDVPTAHLIRVPLSTDWATTANLLTSLDGLVTTDTGIAHLAGAMGIPTWVLLQHVSDWRWALEGAYTPWYPTLQLLRQSSWNDWPSVVEQLRSAIATRS